MKMDRRKMAEARARSGPVEWAPPWEVVSAGRRGGPDALQEPMEVTLRNGETWRIERGAG